MVHWATVTWSQIAWAAVLGFLVCEIGQYLTTAVLHRGLTHGAIRYPPWLKRAVAFWLWLTACIPPLTWIAAHRHHHANSDTEDDPHPPGRRGVWKVVLLSWYYVTRWGRSNREYAERHYLRPFRRERFLHWLDRKDVCFANFYLQIALSVLAGPLGIAFWLGRVPTYILLSGYVNAIGHTFGERPYDNLGTDAAGVWQTVMAYVTGGEPLGHNFHHRYPSSPRFRAPGFDPGYWFATRVLRGVPVERRASSASASAAA
jgi:stearoyl-CoA desaturase (delta-9 desaturase)